MAVDILSNGAPLRETTDLWRYMKLSTLLLLLQGKVFFPSISNLMGLDVFEGQITDSSIFSACLMLEGTLDEKERAELRQWLNDESNSDKTAADIFFPSVLDLTADARRFVRAVTKRRAAWCWFEQDHESAAMWSIYGHQGVAVRTEVGALKDALPSSCDFQISRVLYRKEHESAEDHPDFKEVSLRPHLVKRAEYKHENEVRVVTSCGAKSEGILVSGVAVGALVKEIVLSPLLPNAEVEALIDVLRAYRWFPVRPTIATSSLLLHRVAPGFFGETSEAPYANSDAPPIIRKL